jgi:SH3-like domain-containing protein
VTVTGTDGTGVNFRITPGGAAIGSFQDGTKLTIAGENREANGRSWRNVRSPDGVVGWVAADYLSGSVSAPPSGGTTLAAYIPGAMSGSVQVVKTGGLNAIIRDVPAGIQISSYPEGTTLSLVSTEMQQGGGRDWRNVKGPDGKQGWMASFLLQDVSGGPAVASTSPRSNVTTARSPFTLTADMRARSLAARARAVPLTKSSSDRSSNKNSSSSSDSGSSKKKN